MINTIMVDLILFDVPVDLPVPGISLYEVAWRGSMSLIGLSIILILLLIFFKMMERS